jgi:hypothetical protein
MLFLEATTSSLPEAQAAWLDNWLLVSSAAESNHMVDRPDRALVVVVVVVS